MINLKSIILTLLISATSVLFSACYTMTDQGNGKEVQQQSDDRATNDVPFFVGAAPVPPLD